MPLTDVGICNMALGRLGATAIDALTDTDAEGVQCALHYAQTRDELLRSHPWRFATCWSSLVQDEEADSGTSTDDTNTTLKFYDTGQEWDDDEYEDYYLWISGGTGAKQIRVIASNTATYLVPSVAFTTVPDDTSTYEIWENVPPYPWDYQYDLPSDFLRFVKTDPLGQTFEISGALFKSDESAVLMEYVKQVSDVTLFDVLFVKVLALELAVKMCMPLLHDKTLYKEVQEERDAAMAQARLVNYKDNNAPGASSTWLEAGGH